MSVTATVFHKRIMCKGVEIVCASRFLFLQVKLMRSSEIY